MKRLISLFLGFVLLMCTLSIGFSAYAADTEISQENPLYSERPVLLGSVSAPVSGNSVQKSYQSKTYYSDGKQLYNSYKNQLVARKDKCTVRYLSQKKITSVYQKRTLMNDLFLYATDDEIATGCTDGDYIRWAVMGYDLTNIRQDAAAGGYYYYTLSLNLYYYDTAAQERKVDDEINRFVASVNTNTMSDYDVIKAVHDYICKKTTYDYKAAEDYGYGDYNYAFSPYGALIKGKCVCQGYAAAFYRICKELGYRVRFVSSSASRGCHAWNLVELDGKFYFVDCTWDDEINDGNNKTGIARDYYFLVNYNTVKSNDAAFINQHSLDSVYYNTEYFYNTYESKLDDNNYDRNNTALLSRCTVTLPSRTYGYNGAAKTPAVTVTTASGTVLENGVDYTVRYASNVNTGAAKVQISGSGAYAGATAHRLFYILPTAVPTPRVAAKDSASVTLQWSAVSGGVTGYRIEQYKGGKWQYIGCTASTSYKAAASSAAKVQYRICAYKDVSKRHFYGGFSRGVTAYTPPAQGAVTKLATKSRKITVTYKKVSGSGYEIRYSVNKNMKGAKTVKVAANKTAAVLKKLKKGKKYYVQVRAYKTFHIGGKNQTLYGAWSAKKSVKCK